MPFRCHARNIFLTYPQCNIEKESALATLSSLEPTAKYLLVAEEFHEDGTPHLHAILSFQQPRDIRNERHFDISGHHPNIQSARSLKKSIAYVKKDGKFVETGESPLGNSYETLTKVTNAEEFWEQIKEIDPKSYILHHEKLEYFVSKKFKRTVEEYVSPYPCFNPPNECSNWVEQHLRGGRERPKSLILCGPTRLGKTEWARSLGTHMYFNGMCNFR